MRLLRAFEQNRRRAVLTLVRSHDPSTSAMRFHRRVLAILPTLGLACFGFAGQTPWTPPKTSLPEEIVETTQFLLKHGLGDPRGGEYRVVKIEGESGPYPSEIHGWVLPERSGHPRRVVTLNGMTYPVREVGGPADLDKDLANPSHFFFGFTNSRLQPFSGLIGALLLLRGETERAERLFGRRPDPSRPGEQFTAIGLSCFGAGWEKAVRAHQNGEAKNALEMGRRLAAWRSDFEAEAVRRLGEPAVRQRYDPEAKEGERPVVARFLAPLDDLVRDSERRVNRGEKKIDLAAIKRLPVEERVAALVDAMDEISVQQMGQPGSVIFGEDPVVQALDETGEAALPALFDVVKNDTRLTRSVGFWRDFAPDRQLKSVRQAAIASIQIIFQTFDLSGPTGAFDLDYAKSLWLRSKGTSNANRWLVVLQDDQASPGKWQEAAGNLFKRESVHMLSESSWRGASKPGEAKVPFKAAALPASLRPQLTAILARRTRQLSTGASIKGPYDWIAPLNTLESLALWDNQAARSVGKELLAKIYTYLQDPDHAGNLRNLGARLGEAVDALVRGGDFEALTNYASFLSKIPEAGAALSDSRGKVLAPFTSFKDDPRAQAMTRDLLLSEASSFNLTRLARVWHGTLDDLVSTPLLQIPTVQDGIIGLLDDETLLGTVEARPDQMVALYNLKGEQVTSFSPDSANKAPATGERIPFRVVDSLMTSLARLKGAPAFVAYAPLSTRNHAVSEMKRFLRINAHRTREILPEHSLIWWDISE